MVEKVSVNPQNVRGYGNIITSKELNEFNLNDSVITQSTATVDGLSRAVYTMGYRGGSYFTVTNTEFLINPSETSFDVTVNLKRKSNNANISSASVTCTINDSDTLTGTTDSGNVTFTIPISAGISRYNLKFSYAGNGASIGGCVGFAEFFVGEVSDIELACYPSEVSVGDQYHLVATVTGTDLDGNESPMPLQTVTLYVEYTKGVKLTIQPGGACTVGDTVTLNAQLIDTTDGSALARANDTVEFYMENI